MTEKKLFMCADCDLVQIDEKNCQKCLKDITEIGSFFTA